MWSLLRSRYHRRQPLQELQRAHPQVRAAVAPGGLELEFHLPCIVELHSLVCQRRPGDVAAQLLQPLALVCFDPHDRVQAEPSMSEHRSSRAMPSRAIAPRRVKTFCPARGPKAMR